jgi:hypothetical protein
VAALVCEPVLALLVRPHRDNRPPSAGRPQSARAPATPDLQPPLGLEPVPSRAGRTAAPGPAGHLPDAAAWSAILACALYETIHGRRPPGQLSRWVDERVLASVVRRRRASRGGNLPQRGAAVHSVRLQFPHPEVAEVSAHVSLGARSAALAFRLEGWSGRWLCVALEFS